MCEQSWVLGADGEPLLDEQGQRVHPLSNDWDVNILVQFFVLMGNIDGSTRTLQQHMLSLRLMQPPRYLRPALGGGADTDGWYNKPVRCGLICCLFAFQKRCLNNSHALPPQPCMSVQPRLLAQLPLMLCMGS